ncbi:hypothetical protein C0Q70_00721 [Pomacea canaliculata]|uniref:Uncharacterized protein n=1 Tax=Pomacea canaliculata TaxID=400727 RepID=A0A2T7PXI9_POMCA|nr:hypothetical protein C0Q70_00721 [Pomacea canaliculata]
MIYNLSFGYLHFLEWLRQQRSAATTSTSRQRDDATHTLLQLVSPAADTHCFLLLMRGPGGHQRQVGQRGRQFLKHIRVELMFTGGRCLTVVFFHPIPTI